MSDTMQRVQLGTPVGSSWLRNSHNSMQLESLFFYVRGSLHRESMSIIVRQDATLYSFYSLQTALHVSGDTFTHHQERD
jgi:hypothetical protein